MDDEQSFVNPEHLYMEETSPDQLIFSDDEAKNFRLYEKTVEIIGIAGNLDTPTNQLFKFTLTNVEGLKIQLLAWNPEKERIKTLIRSNFYVHMTALWAKPKNAFSITDYHVDLHVTSLTSVNILGQIQDNEVPLPIARIPVNKFTSIVEAISEKNEIEIEGFLKFSIKEITLPGGIRISQGCLADLPLEAKIELRFRSLVNSTIQMGQHIIARGKIASSNVTRIPYFMVTGLEDVSIASTMIKTSKQMLRANMTPSIN